jgi:hypothetical protein
MVHGYSYYWLFLSHCPVDKISIQSNIIIPFKPIEKGCGGEGS